MTPVDPRPGEKTPGMHDFTPDVEARLLDRPDIHRFAHPAMATIFEVICFSEEGEEYAAQAAQEAFRLVDRLEIDLSCHLSNSDVGRINRAPAGGRVPIGVDTFSCLWRALEWRKNTSGAFDPDFKGARPGGAESRGEDHTPDRTGDRFMEGKETPLVEGAGIALVAGRPEALVLRPVRIDLGAIGKGYAVDSMAGVLFEWDIETALVHGGRSSVYGFGCPPGFDGWPVVIHHPVERNRVLGRYLLDHQAMGASGLEKGHHIIDPRTGDPATHRIAAWVLADDATSADAISTALMVMGEVEAQAFIAGHPELEVILAD
jgi:FAD:protein FMN transferase